MGLAKLRTIDNANSSRRMLVVSAAAGRTSTTSKGHLGISIAVAVLANVLSLASAFFPTTVLPHQSGIAYKIGVLTLIDSHSFLVNSSNSYICLAVSCLPALSVRKEKCLKPRVHAGDATNSGHVFPYMM